MLPVKNEGFVAYGVEWKPTQYGDSDYVWFWVTDNGLSLKYDSLRPEHRWTLICPMGRVGDFDSPDSALAKAAMISQPNYRYKYQILHVCERINSECNGSYIPTQDDLDELVAFLSYRLATWGDSSAPMCARFDSLCRELASEAVRMGSEMSRRKRETA